MMNRLTIILSSLLLFFFLSTSGGFAQVSVIQEKLRELQAKILQASIRDLQEKIDAARARRNLEVGEGKRIASEAAQPVVGLSREELAQSFSSQIQHLQGVVRSLEPRLIEEETARLEAKIKAINEEIPTATGSRLLELREELQKLLADYAKLQERVRQSLKDTIERNQAVILQNQLRQLQERALFVPRAPAPAVSARPDPDAAVKVQVGVLQEQIDNLRLKILREQAKVLQEKIQTLQK